jgi:uncharacterized protein
VSIPAWWRRSRTARSARDLSPSPPPPRRSPDGSSITPASSSDPGPNRPGLRAIEERGVYSPLLAHGVDKATTREMARALGLSAWDRPANACLSSRIPHGQDVTIAKLRTIEAAEDLLHERGFHVVRVRHDGGRARVEVGCSELPRLLGLWPEIEPAILALGFSVAECDPRGYRSGGADTR